MEHVVERYQNIVIDLLPVEADPDNPGRLRLVDDDVPRLAAGE